MLGVENPGSEDTAPGSSTESYPSLGSGTLNKLGHVTRSPISIFRQITETKDEKERKKLNQLLEILKEKLPEGFKIGAAVGKGDCFFDSIAQGLNELKDKGLIAGSKGFSVKSLRENCKQYAQQVNQSKKGSWLGSALKGEGEKLCEYIPRIEFTAEDIENTSSGSEIKILKLENAIWGRPYIEGKIICEKYKVQIKVIELRDEQAGGLHVTIDEHGKGSNVIHIVSYRNHFVPLLSNLKEDIKEGKKVSREEVYGEKRTEKNGVEDQDNPEVQQAIMNSLSSFSQGAENSNPQGKGNLHTISIEPLKTEGDGNCFFHAAFGTFNGLSKSYKTEKAQDMRKEWHRFSSQFKSLEDSKMPEVLKDYLSTMVFTQFTDGSKENDGQVKRMLELAKQKNKKLRMDDKCALYAAYLERIIDQEYYVSTEEAKILASLAGIKIHMYIGYQGQKENTACEQVFTPNSEMVKGYTRNEELWGKSREIAIFHLGIHYSHLPDDILGLSQCDIVTPGETRFPFKRIENTIQGNEQRGTSHSKSLGKENTPPDNRQSYEEKGAQLKRVSNPVGVGQSVQSHPVPAEKDGRVKKWSHWYTAEGIKKEPDLLFLFGDNDKAKYRTDTKNPGGEGQAKATRPTGNGALPFDRMEKDGGLNGKQNVTQGKDLSILKEELHSTLSNECKSYESHEKLQGYLHVLLTENGRRKALSKGDASRKKFDLDECSEKFIEGTLVSKDFKIQLKNFVISDIAEHVYKWNENSNVIFGVEGRERLPERLDKFKKNKDKTLVHIVNKNGNHWVTLVAVHVGNKDVIFYADSYGEEINKCSVSNLGRGKCESPDGDKENGSNTIRRPLDEFLEKEGFSKESISDLSLLQQRDSYNCGVFALENAKAILDEISNGNYDDKKIKEKLGNVVKELGDKGSGSLEEGLKLVREELACGLKRMSSSQLQTDNNKEIVGHMQHPVKEIKIDKKFKKVSNFFFKLVDILKREQKEKEAIKKLEKSIEDVSVGSLLGQFLFKNTDHTERLERYIHFDHKSLQFLLVMSGCSIALDIVVDYDTGKIAYQLNENPNIELAILQDKKNLPSTIQIKEISTSSLVKLMKEKSDKCEKKITDKLSYMIGEVNSFSRLQSGGKEFSVIADKPNFEDVIRGLFENDKFEVSSKSGTSDDAEADLIVQDSGRKDALLVVKLGFNAGEDFVKADPQQYTNGLPKECEDIEDIKVLILSYGEEGIIYKSTFIKRSLLQKKKEQLRKALNCQGIDFSKVKLLIEEMDGTVKNKDGNIALHLAAQINDLETVRWLIDRVKNKESYIKIKGKDGMTVLHYAAQSGSAEAIEKLLSYILTRENKEKYVKDEADGKMTSLHYAAQSGSAEAIEKLLSYITEGNKEEYVQTKADGKMTSLHYAAQSGSAEAIEKLLSYITKGNKEEYVKAEADGKMTPLHYAAQSGSAEAIRELLDYIPEGNREDYVMTNVCRSGKNPLHHAAWYGTLACVKGLLGYVKEKNKKKEYVMTQDGSRMTPLHCVASFCTDNDLMIIDELLKHVDNKEEYVKAKADNKMTPLHYAAKSGNSVVIDELLKHVDNKEEYVKAEAGGRMKPIHYAAQSGSAEAIEKLLSYITEGKEEKYVKAEAGGKMTPLHYAAKGGKVEAIGKLLSYITRENKEKYVKAEAGGRMKPIHYAAQSGSAEAIGKLLDYIPEGNKEEYVKTKANGNMTPLHYAAKGGKVEAIGKLLSYITRENKEKYVKAEADGKMTPLHYAAQSGKIGAIGKLLDYIPEGNKEEYVKTKANGDMTPLHYAAKGGKVGAIGKLLDYIPKGNREDYVMTNVCRSGMNPLHYAAQSGSAEAIGKLLDYILTRENKEKYVKAEADGKMTPLHYAAQSGKIEAIKKLMKCVKNQKNYVNTKNKNGDTALSLVLDSEPINWKLVEFLVGKGADVNTKNKDGNTLSYLAYSCKEVDQNIKKLLIKEGAVFNTKTGDRNITIPVSLDPKVVMVRIESSGKNDLQLGDYVSQKSGQPPSKGDGSNIKTYCKKGKLKNRKINAQPGGSVNLAGKQDNVYEESSLCDSQRSNMELGIGGDESYVSHSLVADGSKGYKRKCYPQKSSSGKSDSRSISSTSQKSSSSSQSIGEKCQSNSNNLGSKTSMRKRPRSDSNSNKSIKEPPKKKAKQSSSPKQNAGEAEGDQFQRQLDSSQKAIQKDEDLETLQGKRFDVLQNKGSVSNNSLEEGNIIENSNLDFQKGDLSDSNEVGKESNLDDLQQSDMELGVNGDESHVSGAKILVTDGGEDHEKERYSQESSSEKSDSRSSGSDFQESEQCASSDSSDESISEKKAKLIREIGEHLDHNGGTILHVLARLVDSRGIRTLVRQGADINAVDEKGFTPLRYGVISASSCALIGFVEELLCCRADPKIKASDGRDVYDILKDKGYSIEDILSRVEDEDHNSIVDGDYTSIVDLLTANRSYTFNFNDEIAYHTLLPIHVAAKMCDAKDLKFLIGIVNNVNDKSDKYNKEAPLHFALSNSSEPKSVEEKINVLIEAGADVNIRSETLGFTPLHSAVRYSSLRAVEILIKAGSNVNDAENYVRFTPLHYAAKGRKEIAQLLIQNGANVNAKGNDGITPLYVAVENGHSEVIDLLLADPNINVGCKEATPINKEDKEGKEKFSQKLQQDCNLFELVEQAAKEVDESKLDKLLKEIEELLKSKNKHSFKPSLNYSPDGNDENTTLKIAIKAGGKLLQLLCDYGKENIRVDTEIFKQLERAKENSQLRSSFNDVTTPHNVSVQQSGLRNNR